MHRNRTWTLDPPEWRTQRNRLLPIEGGDGSTLNLDFTKGVLDPRLTFSRPSNATFVNSSGYVVYAAHNLYYNTNFATIDTTTTTPSLNGTGWNYALDSGVGPRSANFNTNGSVTMSASNARIGILRSVGFAGTGRRLIFSVDITSVGDTGLPPSQLVQEGTKTNESYYINGVLWISGNVVGPCTVSFVFTSNPSGNASTYFGIGMSSNSTGTATFANPRWGLYQSENQLSYYPNTSTTNVNYLTAEYHAPRFDYDPTNIGESKGLLIENQTENVCLNSQALTTGWLNANMITPTNPAIADPFGGTSATWKLVAASGSALHSWRHAVITLTAAAYTFSFWAKAAEYDRVVFSDPGSGIGACTFLLTGNGTATVVGGVTNPQITPYPGGWYRCSGTITALATTYALGIAGYPSGATLSNFGATYTGTGTDGVYATGLQIELGSGASSYIPTGGSKVLRLLDSCSLIGTNFTSVFGDGSLGTIICSHEFPRTDCNFAHQPTPWAIGNYNAANARGFSYANYTGGIGGYGWVYTSSSFGSATTSAVSITKNKCALSYNGLNITAALNGTTASNTGSGTITISSATGFLIGYNSTGPTTGRDFINACISSIKVYPTQLTAAQLQTLTAPDYVAPTLDLNFLNMSSNTDLINSGLTFGRLSPATFVNSSGNVQFANANCFTFSNPRETGTAWSATGVVTWTGNGGLADPIGETNAQLIRYGTPASAIFNTAGTTVVSGITHTFSVWLRAASGTTNARIGSSNTGAVSTVALTTTWQRFSCQYVTNGTNDGGAVYSQTGTASEAIYVWGAQVQPGSIMGDLIQTSGTQSYSTPRFDNTILTSRTNLILQSNNFAPTTWAQKDGTHLATVTAAYEAAPPGFTGTATRITSSNSAAGITQALNVPLVSGKTIRIAFYAKSNTVTAQNCMLYSSSSTSAVVTIPTTWTRIDELAASAVTEITLKGFIDPLDISIYGMQVEYVTSGNATAYIPTTTTQGVANTTTPKGLLMEGSATNYMLQSSSLTGYSVADMATPTGGSVPNPENTADSALQIYATSGANTYHGFYRTLAAGPNTQITVSIWAKARNYTHLFLSDLFSARAAVRFNLTTGATDNNFGLGFVSAKTTAFPNGWWRCEMVVNVTASTSYGWAFVGVPTGATLSGAGAQYAGTGNAADGIYCYGFQVEGGFGASSYIPTGSSSVIRVGDSCVMNNITALKYSTQTGSIYWRGIISKQPLAYTTLIGFQTAIDQPTFETFGNGLNYFTSARGPGLTGGGGNEVSRTFTLNSTIRYASSVNTLTNPIVSVNLNGSAGSVVKSGNGNMHAATRFVIGRQPTITYEVNYPSVTLEQIQYYPTALLAHQLQALVS